MRQEWRLEPSITQETPCGCCERVGEIGVAMYWYRDEKGKLHWRCPVCLAVASKLRPDLVEARTIKVRAVLSFETLDRLHRHQRVLRPLGRKR